MKLFRIILILPLTVCASAAFAQGYITNQNVKYLSVTGWEKLTNLNASTVPYLDANQVLQSSSVTPTQLGFLSTISGAILTNNNTWTVTNKTLDAGSNTLTNISAAYIQGVSVSTTSPTSAQVLLYNSTLSQWAPVSVSGDATITSSGAASVGKIQGNAVLSGAPSAGQALIWNSSGSRWDWETLPISGGGTGQTTQTAAFDALSPLTSAGDLLTFGSGINQRLGTSVGDLNCFLQSGGAIVADSWSCNGSSLTNVNAIKLQSVAVASTSPTGGQFLSYNGTAWAPFSFSSGDLNVSATGVVTVQGLQGVSVKSGTPASGQVLTYNGTTSKWDAEAALTNPMTGWQVIYGNGSGTPQALNIGSTGQALISNGASAAPIFGTPYMAGVATKTANYTLASSDDFIIANTNAFTLTLPTASGITGKVFCMKKGTADTNTITIATTTSQTIDGSSSGTADFALDFQNETLCVVSDGSNWQVLSHTYPDKQYAITASGPAGWSTVSAIAVFSKTKTGVWRAAINVKGTKTSGNGADVTLTGLTFPSFRQACVGNDDTGGSNPQNIFAESNQPFVQLNFNTSQTSIDFSCDVQLNGRPSLSL